MKIFSFLILISIATSNLFSQHSNIRKKEFLIEKGLALRGYDPVSYFSKKPQKGRTEHSYIHEGVKYQFANANNQALFIKNPAKYEPQYGGWCAYAMGNKGEKVEIDPETYKIVDGKLYLFFHPFYNNTLTDWNKDEKNLKQKADINWNRIIKKE
jgi:YHS domain-containing protein